MEIFSSFIAILLLLILNIHIMYSVCDYSCRKF